MTKFTLIFITLSSFALAGDSSLPNPTAGERERIKKVCHHYENRARFMPRGADQDFIATLADGCQVALNSLNDRSTGQRRKAISFLMRLTKLRDTVIDMNMTRVFGKTYTAVTRIPNARNSRTGEVGHVTAYGEFLIAHRMGLIDAYNAWVDSEPSTTLVSRVGN